MPFISIYNSLPTSYWEESHLDPTGLPLIVEWEEDVTDSYQGVLARGTSAARALLAQATDPCTRAYALYVLSVAGQGDLAAAQELLGDKDQLDTFSRAALALALFQEGDSDGANELTDDLVAAAVETSSTAHWPQSDVDGTYNRKAMASTTRATALVLESLTHIRPDSPLLPKAARWLMDRRVGGHWRTTQETAYAILALADYIQVSGELQPDHTYEVFLNDEWLGSGTITAANSMDPIPAIVAPSDLLAYGRCPTHGGLLDVRPGYLGTLGQPALPHQRGGGDAPGVDCRRL